MLSQLGRDKRMAYRIEYSPESETHLQYLTARQQAIVLDTIDEQLMYQPYFRISGHFSTRAKLFTHFDIETSCCIRLTRVSDV